jgi:hypothetical protein
MNFKKGVIATEDIKRNTLIVASKAVSISYDIELPPNQRVRIQDEILNTEKKPYQVQSVADLIYKAQNDPYLAQEIYKLYAGKDYPRDEKTLNELHTNKIIDAGRLYAILHYNSFASNYDDFDAAESDPDFLIHESAYKRDWLKNENQGLWLVPSFFNHSCLANTKMDFFADFVMIHTSKSSFLTKKTCF